MTILRFALRSPSRKLPPVPEFEHGDFVVQPDFVDDSELSQPRLWKTFHELLRRPDFATPYRRRMNPAEFLDDAECRCNLATKEQPFVYFTIDDANKLLRWNGEGELQTTRDKHGFHWMWLLDRLPYIRARLNQLVISELEKL